MPPSASYGRRLSLLVPLGLALVLGKVFCSHLCPMRLTFELGDPSMAFALRDGVRLSIFPAEAEKSAISAWLRPLLLVTVPSNSGDSDPRGRATGLLHWTKRRVE